MPVSHSYKIIFVHIPKTGGTSVEFALGMHGKLSYIGIIPYIKQKPNYDTLFGNGLQHLTLDQILNHLKIQKFNSYSNFASIKHRYDQITSIFKGKKDLSRYYKFTIVRNPYDRLVSYFTWCNNFKKENDINDFERFITRSFTQKINPKIKFLSPQYHFFIKNSKNLVDKILKFESLEQDFDLLCKELNVKCNLPHRMKSNHKNYEYYYSDKNKEIVFNAYKKDFELFGYSK